MAEETWSGSNRLVMDNADNGREESSLLSAEGENE